MLSNGKQVHALCNDQTTRVKAAIMCSWTTPGVKARKADTLTAYYEKGNALYLLCP